MREILRAEENKTIGRGAFFVARSSQDSVEGQWVGCELAGKWGAYCTCEMFRLEQRNKARAQDLKLDADGRG